MPDSDEPVTACPFRMKHSGDERDGFSVKRESVASPTEAIAAYLPENGSIKIRRDRPHFEHSTHAHEERETLVILEGCITFQVEHEKYACSEGDVIRLPAGTTHASVAGATGCVYLIATHG